MILCPDESKEIKELLSEIPSCKIDEFKGEEEHFEKEAVDLTEPNDSPFRVRRLSRSFSIPSSSNNEEKVKEEKCEILVLSEDSNQAASDLNDENKESTRNSSETPKSKFIVLKRSRSLGNIYLPDLPKSETADDIASLTEKVEALEIEVLPCEAEVVKSGEEDRNGVFQSTSENLSSKTVEVHVEVNKGFIDIDRPQTSPPILYPINNEKRSRKPAEAASHKMSILDRMQKSIGFFFQCTRRDENSSEDERLYKYPLRSRTPDAKPTFKSKSDISYSKTGKTDKSDIPMMSINNFVTKLDESAAPAAPVKCGEFVKKIPQFYDIPGPKRPLLQPQSDRHSGRKCLVLDLDETLVHSSFHVPEAYDLVVSLNLPDSSVQNLYVAKRPGVDGFLARMSERFEVVIFTASLAHYADPVIDFLAKGMNRYLSVPDEINLRLYRESCLFLRGLYVKDLSRLGRKLEQTVIVDNSPASFLLQPDHGIPIKSWFSDSQDVELLLLQESLMNLVEAENVSEWKSKIMPAS